jgi:hypothetical protein
MPHYGWNQFLRISQRAAAARPGRPSSGAITFEGRSVEQIEEAIWSQGTYFSPLVLRNSIVGGLEIRTKKKGQPVENVIQIGCAGPGVAVPLKAYCDLLRRLGVDYGFLHKEHCCGLPLVEIRAGEGFKEGESERQYEACKEFIGANIDMARELGAKAIYHFCIWCWIIARRFYPDCDVAQRYYPDILVDLLKDKPLAIKPQTVAYFPGGTHGWAVAAGEDADWDADWPGYRELLDKIEGLSVVDVPNYCCQVTRDPIYKRAEPYGTLLTNCVRCYGGLQRNAPPGIRVRSYPDFILEALGPASSS